MHQVGAQWPHFVCILQAGGFGWIEFTSCLTPLKRERATLNVLMQGLGVSPARLACLAQHPAGDEMRHMSRLRVSVDHFQPLRGVSAVCTPYTIVRLSHPTHPVPACGHPGTHPSRTPGRLCLVLKYLIAYYDASEISPLTLIRYPRAVSSDLDGRLQATDKDISLVSALATLGQAMLQICGLSSRLPACTE